MKPRIALLLQLAVLLFALDADLHVADMLVAINGSWCVERYDSTGRYLGAFIRGLDHPNALAFGPEGALYVGTGSRGRTGCGEAIRRGERTLLE